MSYAHPTASSATGAAISGLERCNYEATVALAKKLFFNSSLVLTNALGKFENSR